MAEITISADVSKATTFLDAFPKQTGIALLRALKRGTKSAATHAGRVAAKDMGLKVRDARKRIKVKPPNGQTLTGEVHASLVRIPIIEFSAKGPRPSRGRGRGVSYRIGGGRRTNPNAFIATIGRREGVFERRTRSRTPTRELFGPSVGRVVDRHAREITAKGVSEFEKEFDRLLDRILSGFGGRLA